MEPEWKFRSWKITYRWGEIREISVANKRSGLTSVFFFFLRSTPYISVCLVKFKLSIGIGQAAIHHRIRRSRSDIPATQFLFALSWGNGKKSKICQFQIFFNIFLFLGAICTIKSKKSDDSPLLQLFSTRSCPPRISLTVVGFTQLAQVRPEIRNWAIETMEVHL